MNDESVSTRPLKGARWQVWTLLLGAGFYLCANLFTLRGTPFLLGGDQVFFWTDAQRMRAGEHIYQDFFQFTPPGADLVYYWALRLSGWRIWATNLIVLVLGLLLGWVCYRIALAFLERRSALLAASLVLVVLFGKPLNGTHAWFSELAVLGAIAILMPQRSGARIALAGSLLGAATLFTQTRGPAAAAGLALFLLWDRWRTRAGWAEFFQRIALMAAPMLAVWAVLSFSFIATTGADAPGLEKLLYWQVFYPARFKVSGPWTLGLPGVLTAGSFIRFSEILLVYATLPVVYAVSLWTGLRERGNSSTEMTARRMMLTLVGLMTTLEVAQSPNWLRIYCVAAPGIVLLAWMVSNAGRLERCFTIALWIGVAGLALGQIAGKYREQPVTVQMPSGRAAMAKPVADKMAWIITHTRPGDFFLQAAWPGIYLPLDLRNPVFAEDFRGTDDTRPEFVEKSIRQLEERHVRYIVWTPRLDQPEEPDHPETYHLAPLREYLEAHYRQVWTFSDQDEVWERR